jgi:hypothetical protein
MGMGLDDCGSPDRIFRPGVVAPRVEPVPMAQFTPAQEFAAALAKVQFTPRRNELTSQGGKEEEPP